MKFEDETFPVLATLRNGQLTNTRIIYSPNSEETELIVLKEMADLYFKRHLEEFRSRIMYISNPLKEAMDAAEDKVLQAENILNLSTHKGTLLLPNGFQYLYSIQSDEGSEEWSYCYFCFKKDILFAFEFSNGIGKNLFQYFADFLDVTHYRHLSEQALFEEKRRVIFNPLILSIAFLKFAEIETKIVKPQQPVYDGLKAIYNNKTKYPIEIIGSNWFTTIVRSEGFKVSGHFRFQPVGQGRASKKLIWIDNFQKTGYKRSATKLQNPV